MVVVPFQAYAFSSQAGVVRKVTSFCYCWWPPWVTWDVGLVALHTPLPTQ
jgi:hypothetical protein